MVLEARNRLGGRATAFTDRATGEWVDNGQHVLLGCYRDTFDFLETIGAGDRVRRTTRLSVDFVEFDGTRSRLECPPLPPPWHLVAGAWRWSALGWRDRLALLRMGAPLGAATTHWRNPSQAAPTSPDETVAQWLNRHGQTPRLRELLWDPLALAALNQPADVAAAAPFARVLAEMFGGGADAAAIVLPAVPLHQLYAEPARAFIESRGGAVMLGATAAVEIDRDHVSRVNVGDRSWIADAVILAVPWFALDQTLTGDRDGVRDILEAARGTAPSPIVTVNLWYDRPVLNVPFLGLPGRSMQWVFDKQAVFGGTAAHLSLVASGAPELSARTNDDLIATADKEIREALPPATAAQRVNATVIREPRATFSLAPGQPRRPSNRTEVQGLWLAGDWTDTALPATIEGAVRSGHQAAGQILNPDVRKS